MEFLPPPGPQRTRQLRLLGLLVVLIAGLAWYQFSDGTPTGSAPAESNSTIPGSGGGLGTLPEPLKLAALEDDHGAPESARDPFRYGPPPAPPPAPPAPQGPPPPPPLPPPAPTGPPPIPLELVGLWQPQGMPRIASLRHPATNTTVLAVEGQIIDGRYRLVTIQEQSVIVTYLDGTGQRTLPLQRGGGQ
jgi:hypothetical protein